MNLSAPAEIAKELRAGRYPDAQPWNLASAAQSIADSLTSRNDPPPVSEIRKVVEVLNGHRHFDLTRKIASGWLDVQGFDVTIQKRLVQALINSALLDEAEKLALDGLDKAGKMPADAQAVREIPEYQGLIGRIFKQRFVLSNDPNWLVKASDQYLAEYIRDTSNNYWHGINAVALLARESRDGAARPGVPGAQELAKNIRTTVAKAFTKTPRSWLAVTAAEACLAAGLCDQAELWLYRFLNLPDTRPFEIDSFERQLREVWQADPLAGSSCAGRLAGIITRHLARSQSRLVLDPAELPAMKDAVEKNQAALERNFSGEAGFSVSSIRSLLKACESIGCVVNAIGERLGTGYLLRGSWLKPEFGDSAVFITNAHVISDAVANAIPSKDARVTFELDASPNGARPIYKVKDILSTSPPGKIGVTNDKGAELDYTLVTLEGLPANAPVLEVAANLPLIKPLTKAFVAGHPRGAGLQVSLQDSTLLDIDDDDRLMHYRTPTDPGSSGSPVFNSDWQVMALHHAGTSETPRLHGAGTYEANEAIALLAIRKKLNS